MTVKDTIRQETELQRRKVAAIERQIALIDYDLKAHEEFRLVCAHIRNGYVTKLAEEQNYLEWLEQGAPVDDPPAKD